MGVFPHFSAYGIGPSRVYGESYSTTIIGLRAPTTLLYLCGAARRGATVIHGKRPDQDANWIGFPISKIFSKGKEITFITVLSTFS
jgi:hypothetical protein